MQIRESKLKDAIDIENLYLQTFDISESKLVSDCAVSLLQEESKVNVLSFVAIDDNQIIAHTAFSPVFLESSDEHFGYILAPLAVSPTHQNKGIGSAIVQHGLDAISSLGAFIVFVYGDPNYYSRFGFQIDLGKHYSPPYALEYPEGLQAMQLNSPDMPEGGAFKCVNSLNDQKLW